MQMALHSWLLVCCALAALLAAPAAAYPSPSYYYRDMGGQYGREDLADMLTRLTNLIQMERKMDNEKRALDLGLSRGYSGALQANYLMGLAAANSATSPGRRRRDVAHFKDRSWPAFETAIEIEVARFIPANNKSDVRSLYTSNEEERLKNKVAETHRANNDVCSLNAVKILDINIIHGSIDDAFGGSGRRCEMSEASSGFCSTGKQACKPPGIWVVAVVHGHSQYQGNHLYVAGLLDRNRISNRREKVLEGDYGDEGGVG
ncbi:Diuretic hormone class 2 [Eumeta japonica]|uniref:Diuretic hormone class 2 n=1 Tax=Eumeta variegata TaxID=151549 RepID=A0A4C1TYU6_EUMVA|nr:Diuretic hormone class 2 [Eumeta japonica]